MTSNQTLKHCSAILFDLDGTLVDSVPDITVAINHMLQQHGFADISEARVRGWVGNGFAAIVQRALLFNNSDLDGHDAQQPALRCFREYYQNHVCSHSRVYDGVSGTLNALKSAGFKLAVVTNKDENCTLPLLQALDLLDFFEAVVSGDSCAHKKPHPVQIEYALKQLSISHEQAVMVGDSANDIRAAHAASIPCIAFSYGYSQGVDLASENPYTVLKHFSALNHYFIDA